MKQGGLGSKEHAVFKAILLLVPLIFLAGCSNANGFKDMGAPPTGIAALFAKNPPSRVQTAAALFNVGDRVNMGNLAVTIRSVKVSPDNKEFNKPAPSKKNISVNFKVENLGEETAHVSKIQFGLVYSMGGSPQKLTLPATADSSRKATSEIGAGQNVEGEIFWEIPKEAAVMNVVFDDNVFVRQMGDDLVNGPVTVVAQRKGNGQALFAVNNESGMQS